MASARESSYDLLIEKTFSIQHLIPSGYTVCSMDIDPVTQNVLLLLEQNFQQELILCDSFFKLIAKKSVRLPEPISGSLNTVRFLPNGFIFAYSRNQGNSDYLFLLDSTLNFLIYKSLGYIENYLLIFDQNSSYVLTEGAYHQCALIKIETRSQYENEFEGFEIVENEERLSFDRGIENIQIAKGLPLHFRTLSDFHGRNFLEEKKSVTDKTSTSFGVASYIYGMQTLADNTIVVCGKHDETLFLSFCQIRENNLFVNSVVNVGKMDHFRAYFHLSSLSEKELVLSLRSMSGLGESLIHTLRLYYLKKLKTEWKITPVVFTSSKDSVIDVANLGFSSFPPPFFLQNNTQPCLVNLETNTLLPLPKDSTSLPARNNKLYLFCGNKVLLISIMKTALRNTLESLPILHSFPRPLISVITSYVEGYSFFSRPSLPDLGIETKLLTSRSNSNRLS